MSSPLAFSADGHDATWETWDGEHTEHSRCAGRTRRGRRPGHVGRERVEYVLRLSPTWRVRQFLLFRDLDEPDLWLAHRRPLPVGRDQRRPSHRSRRVRGHRARLVAVPRHVPIRRLPLGVGDRPRCVVAVDVETLAVGRRRAATPASASGTGGSPTSESQRGRSSSTSTTTASSSTSPAASAAATGPRRMTLARGRSALRRVGAGRRGTPAAPGPSSGRAGRARSRR